MVRKYPGACKKYQRVGEALTKSRKSSALALACLKVAAILVVVANVASEIELADDLCPRRYAQGIADRSI